MKRFLQVAAISVALVMPLPAQSTLPPPKLLTPGNGYSVLSPVAIRWQPVTLASGYRSVLFPGTVSGGSIEISGPALSTQTFVGSNSTSASLPLPPGVYVFGIQSCAAPMTDPECGASETIGFHIETASTRLSLDDGAVASRSTLLFGWPSMPGNSAYRFFLSRNGIPYVADRFPANQTSAPYSIQSGDYILNVRGEQTGSETVSFRTTLGPVPTAKPTISSATVANNRVTVSFQTVPLADLYFVHVVGPVGGPGGGAFSVSARMVDRSPVVLDLPKGGFRIVVAGCNGDGCGPYSDAFPIDNLDAGTPVPIMSSPADGAIVDGPGVLFAWNRVPWDNGFNTTYRLYVQDMVRARPALEVFTTRNFWGTNLAPGVRYDVLVIADPGPGQTVGPASGFVVRGPALLAPSGVLPGYESTVSLGGTTGPVTIEWTPLNVNRRTLRYEYYFRTDRLVVPDIIGGTNGATTATVQAFSGESYEGVVRACWPEIRGSAFLQAAGCSEWSDRVGANRIRFRTTQ